MTDYLIVGAGLFGSVVARELHKAGKSVLVIEKKSHIGGTVYTEDHDGICVHKCGAHIFRTNEKWIWDYVNDLTPFNNFINSPMAMYHNQLYNLPFNMNTFNEIWGVKTPEEARKKIDETIVPLTDDTPDNLEDWAKSLVGTTIYDMFIKEYTEKQWGKKCSELPSFIMHRIPLRFTFDNNYYSNKQYQGIPIQGYTKLIEKLLEGIDVILNCDGKEYCHKHGSQFKRIIYTGPIDEFFDYEYGPLEYRSLKFEERVYNFPDFQGVAVVNHTDKSKDYTRTIEHQHFLYDPKEFTVVSYEYPVKYEKGITEPIYPVVNKENASHWEKYFSLGKYTTPNISFEGRLGSYLYSDMEDTIKNAKKFVMEELQ